MNPLLKLLAMNKGKSKPVKSEMVNGEPTVYIYGVIVSDDDWGGISAESFARELNSYSEPRIHVRIHSPGGDAFAGVAMAQIIKDHPSEIVVHIDGDAASAATFPVVAADKSVISKRARFMIHNAWTIAAGNQFDFAYLANHLARVDQNIAEDYAAKTGHDVAQQLKWMKETTFFYGDEAVTTGFVDEVAEDFKKDQAQWDYSAYEDKSFQSSMVEALAKFEKEGLHKKPIKQQATDTEPEPEPQPEPTPEPTPEPEPEKPDLSAHYRQLEVVQLTA